MADSKAGGMKRFLIFAFVFPPIALVIFNIPDVVMRHDFRSLDIATLGMAYTFVIIPALIPAWVDHAFRSLEATTIAGGLMSTSIALFLWSGFAEASSVLMAALVGAVPAAVCSWLSKERAA
jgi:hypothetical protein